MSRRTKWLLGVLGGIIVLGVAGVLAAPYLAGRMVRSRILPALAKKLGREVTVGRVATGYGTVTLYDLVVRGPRDGGHEPLATIAEVHVDYRMWRAVLGDIHVNSVSLDGVRVHIRRDAEGQDNVSDLLARLRGKGDGGEHRSSRLMPAGWIKLEHGSVDLRDDKHALRASVGEVSVLARRGEHVHVEMRELAAHADPGPKAEATKLTLEAQLKPASFSPDGPPRFTVAGGRIVVLKSLALTGIQGTIATGAGAKPRDPNQPTLDPEDDPSRFEIDLAGGYGGVDGELWQARGWVLPRTRDAAIQLKADQFMLDRLAPLVRREGSPIVDPEKTSIRADLSLRLREGKLAFDGNLDFSGLSVKYWRLAADTVRDMSARSQVRGEIDLAKRELRIDDAVANVHDVELRLSGRAAKPVGARPQFQGRLTVPSVPCQTALDAIPTAFVPSLQGFKLTGNFEADVHVGIDMNDIQGTDLGGDIGIRGCKVTDAPPELDHHRFERPFEHHAEVYPGHWMTFVVGRQNPDYTPIDKISPYIINSLMTTEDSGFYHHHGFITHEFRSALIRNLERGSFRQGASSITMQMVKNVMMTREKTLSRKFQELFLTWYVEQTMSKDRIMEIYLNVIEFGPELFGVGAATRHYFGKDPADVTPLEASFFSSILPNPKQRYIHRCEPELDDKWSAYLRRIVGKMHERGRITDEEYAAAMEQRLAFNQATAMAPAECRARVHKAVAQALAAGKSPASRSVRPASSLNIPDEPDEPDPGDSTDPTPPDPEPDL